MTDQIVDGHRKILIVAPMSDRRDELQRDLVELEYDVIACDDVTKAEFQLHEFHPDLIMLSWQAEGRVNGAEWCQELKSDPGTANIRIMLLDRRESSPDQEFALLIGADAYGAMTDDVDISEILSKAEHCFED